MTFQDIWWQLLLLAIFSYLFGNINSAIIISKLKKTDVRSFGSGNPGTMNMSRHFGVGIGALTLILDILKGVIPTVIGYYAFKGKMIGNFEVSDLSKYLCGLFVIIGHIYPVFLKFKGGKGIASTMGVFVASDPLIGIIFVIVCLLFITIYEYGSMGSLLAITVPAIIQVARFYNKYVISGTAIIPLWIIFTLNVMLFLICLLTWYAHRENIKRLIAGNEHKTSIIGMFKKNKKVNQDDFANSKNEERDRHLEDEDIDDRYIQDKKLPMEDVIDRVASNKK